MERLRPYGQSLENAVEFYVRHLESCHRSLPVSDLIEKLLESKRLEGMSGRYLKDLRNRLDRFKTDFGDRMAASVTTEEVRDWLNGLEVSNQTRKNFRRVVATLFGFALDSNYVRENPVAAIKAPKVVTEEPGILTPDEVARLLEAAPSSVVPYIAIGCFAGLRTRELQQLDWQDVMLEQGLIKVPARVAKTASKRFVEIEANLAEWLRPYKQPSGAISPANLRKLLEKAREDAGIQSWPTNSMRHSYASYWLARNQDAAKLARQMGHVSSGLVFQHYHQLVPPKEAERYWAIAPRAGHEKTVAFPQAQVSYPPWGGRQLLSCTRSAGGGRYPFSGGDV